MVVFGRWEQDNNKKNGAEPIQWYVLATSESKTGSKSLLLSVYALDAQTFHTSQSKTLLRQSRNWDKCSLRTWLNRTFYSKAFTTTEKSRIIRITVSNNKKQCAPEYQ